MINIEWHNCYEIGIDFIDQEHKKILAIMQNLRDAIINENNEEYSYLSDSLIKKVKSHFINEENFLDKVKFPGLEEHKRHHESLIMQISRIKEICDCKNKNYNLIGCFDAMENFIIDDIMNGDMQYVSFLEYEGHIKRKFYI